MLILAFIVAIIIIITILCYIPSDLAMQLRRTNYDYILEEYPVDSKIYHYPSSYIFKLFTQSKYPTIYQKAIQLQKYFGVNKTVYGIKKSNDAFSFEFYYYYPNENSLHTISNIGTCFSLPISEDTIQDKHYYLASFDINPHAPNTITDLNLYYTLNDCSHNSPYNYHSHTICQTCKMTRNITYNTQNQSIVDKNVYKFFYKDSPVEEIYDYTRSLLNQDVDMKLMFPPYLMNFKKAVCVSSKPGGAIGLYFNLVPFYDFITFLNKTKFSETLEAALIQDRHRLSYLLFDIGIDITVIDFNTIEIRKVAFYGIL